MALDYEGLVLPELEMIEALHAAGLPADDGQWTLAQMHRAAEVLGAAQAVHIENVAGRIEHDILERGPWQVAQRLGGLYWYIENKVTGARVKIGRVGGKRVNYFDRAREEAIRRNLALQVKGGA